MKSCRNCKQFNLNDNVCKIHGAIIDKTIGTYCTKYIEKRNLPKGKVKCIKCSEMNKYGWCNSKKRCLSESERFKERICSKFKKRKYKAPKKKAN